MVRASIRPPNDKGQRGCPVWFMTVSCLLILGFEDDAAYLAADTIAVVPLVVGGYRHHADAVGGRSTTHLGPNAIRIA
jgi:hypothetical protein